MTRNAVPLERKDSYVGLHVHVVKGKYNKKLGQIISLCPKKVNVQLYSANGDKFRVVCLPCNSMEVYDKSTALEELTTTVIIASSASKAKKDGDFDVEDLENDTKSSSTGVSVSTINSVSSLTSLDDVENLTPSVKHHLQKLCAELKAMNIGCNSLFAFNLVHIAMQECEHLNEK